VLQAYEMPFVENCVFFRYVPTATPVAVMARTSAANGRAVCTWRLRRADRGKSLHGSVGVSYRGASVSRTFAAGIR